MTGGGEWRDRESGGGLETYKQKKTEGKKIVNTFKKINIWVISSPWGQGLPSSLQISSTHTSCTQR